MNRKSKTLVILTPGFAKDESDTTCLPMQQTLIRALNKRIPDLDIVILAFQYPYETKTYRWYGNTVLSFNGRNRGGLSKIFLFQKWSAALTRIHKEYKIDGLLSFWYRECALVGKRFGNKHGIKHFCWIWGQDAKKGNKYVSLTRLKAGELVAFSDFLRDEFERNYGLKPAHVITPAIDTDVFSAGNPEKDIDIIGVGSLIPLKQYDIFISVINEIKKQFPLINAVIIGDGPEKQKLQTLITSSGLKSNVTLIGELSHPEVLKWMQRSKLFLHTSSYEGFGVVCIEALCAGARVISFIRPMHDDIENWYVAQTEEEMINRSMKLLEEPGPSKRIVPFQINQTAQKIADLFSF